jgi:hypothetical protein
LGESYCQRCHRKTRALNEELVTTESGRRAVKASCAVCGSSTFRFVSTEEAKRLVVDPVTCDSGSKANAATRRSWTRGMPREAIYYSIGTVVAFLLGRGNDEMLLGARLSIRNECEQAVRLSLDDLTLNISDDAFAERECKGWLGTNGRFTMKRELTIPPQDGRRGGRPGFLRGGPHVKLPSAAELASVAASFDQDWGGVDEVLYAVCAKSPARQALSHSQTRPVGLAYSGRVDLGFYEGDAASAPQRGLSS